MDYAVIGQDAVVHVSVPLHFVVPSHSPRALFPQQESLRFALAFHISHSFLKNQNSLILQIHNFGDKKLPPKLDDSK